jgi:hypothetical protein
MDMEIIMFMDNGHRLAIPCSSLTDDKALMKHLHIFYDLVRTGGGIFEFFGTRSSQRIDIVEVSPNTKKLLSPQLIPTVRPSSSKLMRLVNV